jgi:hypothetical protein
MVRRRQGKGGRRGKRVRDRRETLKAVWIQGLCGEFGFARCPAVTFHSMEAQHFSFSLEVESIVIGGPKKSAL